MHCGPNSGSLKYNSKISINFFLLLHNFTDRRFVLTIDSSNPSIQSFSFFISQELLPLHLKEVLYGFYSEHVDCQHHCSGTLGSWLSKIRVTWTQALWYHGSQSANGNGYWMTNGWNTLDKGLSHIWAGRSGTAWDFITLLATEHNLKLMDCLFL